MSHNVDANFRMLVTKKARRLLCVDLHSEIVLKCFCHQHDNKLLFVNSNFDMIRGILPSYI